MRKLKIGEIVRVRAGSLTYNGTVNKIGSKYIYVLTVGTKSTEEKFDIQTGFLVTKDGQLYNQKQIL